MTASTATTLEPAGEREWTCMLSRAWEIWGPNGGHLAAIALDAARREAQRSRPANATVHFLGVASFDEPVEVEARTLRRSRVASSVGVSIRQGERPILEALVWSVDDGLDGLSHDESPAPEVPHWRDLPTAQERLNAAGLPVANRYAFWDRFEQRPPEWIADWDARQLGRPLYRNWLRFLDEPVTMSGGAAWAQAARLLLLVDLGGWPSIGRRHMIEEWIAPSIDVSCEFHRPATGDDWFLLQGESPAASDGLIATHQHVWNDRGELLASGISHLLCRRI